MQSTSSWFQMPCRLVGPIPITVSWVGQGGATLEVNRKERESQGGQPIGERQAPRNLIAMHFTDRYATSEQQKQQAQMPRLKFVKAFHIRLEFAGSVRWTSAWFQMPRRRPVPITFDGSGWARRHYVGNVMPWPTAHRIVSSHKVFIAMNIAKMHLATLAHLDKGGEIQKLSKNTSHVGLVRWIKQSSMLPAIPFTLATKLQAGHSLQAAWVDAREACQLALRRLRTEW